MKSTPRTHRLASAVAVLASLFIGSPLYAQSPTSASFGSGEKSLAELIEFPELRGDASVAIFCTALLKGNGKLDSNGCYQQNPGDEAFIAAIYKASRKARLRPATFDGKPVEVVFQYRVQFTQKGEEKSLRFVANPGYEENVLAYGADHVAAQRLYGKELWEKACPRHAKFTVLVKANVDFDGTASAASVTSATGLNVTEKCSQAIIETVESSRYVPAYADGEPVPSTFIEPFGN